MNPFELRTVFDVRWVFLAWVLSYHHAGAADVKTTDVQFSRDVRPILAENCFACHGFDEAAREADLRLDRLDELLQADGDGGLIVPGKPDQSELIARILSDDPSEMMPPPDSGKRLTLEQQQMLQVWIEQGAAYESHWSFAPPKRTTPPKMEGIAHPIDRFIQARLATEGLRPSDRAPRETLIRRVSLDLVGLPPTLEEVDAFVAAAEKDPDSAFRELVDRLLCSPHYGERWGRWWLDQARYADSNGYSIDAPRNIWKYRDWVIEALNNDMPFDAFTIEQLAGDLLPDATESQKVATGFHRNTQINQEGGIDPEQFRVDSVFDRVATTGTVWLGLSIGCAQCHDHKFDPITQVEYYRMFAFLNNQDEPTLKVYGNDVDVAALTSQRNEAKQRLDAYLTDHHAAIGAWEQAITQEAKKKLSSEMQKALDTDPKKRSIDQRRLLYAEAVKTATTSDTAFQTLQTQYVRLEARLNKADTTLVMQERAAPRKTHVLIKGDFTRPAEEVTPGTPSVLHPLASTGDRANRLDLARWLVSRENPLTARVIVNRIWQQYFGRGLCEIENDFGLQGASPSHPELLDWLAIEFMERGWSLMEIHRLIVTSHAYQQSSINRPDLQQQDPDNYLLARQQRLRLDAEIVRDVSLASSGLLTTKLGGPPVYPPIPNGVMNQGQVRRSWSTSNGEDRYRRGIYTFKFRATPPPSLNVFDAPDGFSSCTSRIRSNTPLQALTLMNDPAFVECAQAMERIIQESGLEVAFRRCTSRAPTAEELAILSRLDRLGASRALLNLDETITRE